MSDLHIKLSSVDGSVSGVSAENRGPRGADLTTQVQADARKSPFNAPTTSTGVRGLHRYHDVGVVGIKNEKPWHRMAAYMLANGMSNAAVAKAAGVTTAAVTTLKGQRWFQELLATISNETGENIAALIQSEAIASIQTIVELRDDTEVRPNVRLSAAVTLLEHAKGKPTQAIITTNTTAPSDPRAELESVQAELAALERASQPSVN